MSKTRKKLDVIAYLEMVRNNSFVDVEGCWVWKGPLSIGGYGPHRRVYIHVYSSIPYGFEIDHVCNKTYCVNPGHLEAVSGQEHRKRTYERRHERKMLEKWIDSCTDETINLRIREIGQWAR